MATYTGMTFEQAEKHARQTFDAVGGLDALAKDIESIKADIEPEFIEDEDDTPHIDIRLNYQPAGCGCFIDDDRWNVRTGDSSYDQDHRGFWGSGCVTEDCDAQELAKELFEQVMEHYAQSF